MNEKTTIKAKWKENDRKGEWEKKATRKEEKWPFDFLSIERVLAWEGSIVIGISSNLLEHRKKKGKMQC